MKDNFAAYIPKDTKNNIHNLHAIRIETTQNLEKDWIGKSSFIKLTIISKHS
ncbi:MAG: hypothetical protein H7174_06050 [Flavobacterium sp.]|nr:hypothetical protein [Flavobacterium sp.]